MSTSRDPCLLVYASGSTGAPKGALLHHSGIIDFAILCNSLWPLAPHRVINYFPINHIGSAVDCMMPCLVAGGAQIMLEQFDPAVCLELIERERITLWGSVPSVFQMQLALPGFARFDLSSVQLIAWGGAAMPRETIERLRSLCPNLATNYGMTETSSAITIIEPTDDLDILANTVGHPRPGVEVRLVDDQGPPVPVGHPGEIQVRSPCNFLGYWQQPDATAAAFTDDGFFRTGDLGEQRSDGRIRLIGRLKEMYKSGGYNVYPREVETVIEAHPGVASAAVVSIPTLFGKKLGSPMSCPMDQSRRNRLNSTVATGSRTTSCPNTSFLVAELPLLPSARSISARYAFGPSATPHRGHERDFSLATRCIAARSAAGILPRFTGSTDCCIRYPAHRAASILTAQAVPCDAPTSGCAMAVSSRLAISMPPAPRIASMSPDWLVSSRLHRRPGQVHADEDMLLSEFRRDARNDSPGVTTAVFGIDGGYSLGEFRELRQRLQCDGAGVNPLSATSSGTTASARMPSAACRIAHRQSVKCAHARAGATGDAGRRRRAVERTDVFARPVCLDAGSDRPDPRQRAFRRHLRLA